MGFYNYGQQQRGILSSPTYVLIILNVLVFLVMLVSGDFGDCSSITCQLMAQTTQAVIQGEYWQLFTSMFVHFGFLHIIFNMFALYYFGRLNETFFSSRSYLTIYFVSGLLGNVVSLFMLPAATLSGGASGAIFGLVGSYVAIARKARHMGVALLYAVMMLIYSGVGVAGMDVNNFAHVFGFVGGLAVGLLLSRSRSSPEPGYSVSYTYG
jgi:rhomboid protease GluP